MNTEGEKDIRADRHAYRFAETNCNRNQDKEFRKTCSQQSVSLKTPCILTSTCILWIIIDGGHWALSVILITVRRLTGHHISPCLSFLCLLSQPCLTIQTQMPLIL